MSEQQQGAVAEGEIRPGMPQSLYSRPMPGGGHVRVELLMSDRDVSVELLRGRVVMETRAAPRAASDEPLIVAEVEGSDANLVVAELIRIARDNAAIARRVLRRQAGVPRAD